MSNHYVSGCKGQDDDIVTCDDSEAEFWTIYRRDSMGLSQGLVDFTFREDAEAAMKVYEEREALQEQLTATTNSLTNAQEALKSAGIEADTVQAGVMELALMRDKMAAVARDFASAITWADDVGALSMTELKRYDLDRQCEEAISRAKMDIIDAADAFLNAVRADAVEDVAKRLYGQGYNFEVLTRFAAQLRAGNAGKDGV